MPEELLIQTKLNTLSLKKSTPPGDRRLWVETIIYSLIILFIVNCYYLLTNTQWTARMFNRAVGDVAILITGLSLMLSSLCYFWNFADKFIIYRKHLGLVGFGYVLLHGVLSLILTDYTPFAAYYLNDKRILSFTAALIATLIFGGMALISNRLAIHEIGPHLWRRLMRIGFLGFALVLFHFGQKGWTFWLSWLMGKSESLFPSFGLIVFVFGIGVLILRGALAISIMRRHTGAVVNPQKPKPSPQEMSQTEELPHGLRDGSDESQTG